MKYIHVWRGTDLVDVTGNVRRISFRRHWVKLVADDRTVTYIPRETISRVKIEKSK